MEDNTTPDSENPNVNPGGNDDPKPKTVSYETHAKLLDEKKKASARLAELEAAEEARKLKALEEKGEYQKIIEQKEKELADKNSKLHELTQRETDRLKLSSLLKALPGTVDPKFYKFIDQIDDIVVNPETGEVDEVSVNRAAEKFRKQYPEWIQTKKSGLPNDAPGGGANRISRAEWMKLPSKEMTKWRPDQISD